MNMKLRKKILKGFGKDFFKLVNNAVFRKNLENVGKYRGIELVTTEKRRNCLISKPNYHINCFLF